MLRPTVEIEGKRFVLIEEAEFRQLAHPGRRRRQPAQAAALPEPDEHGYVPALEFIRATIAQDIARERTSLGLTQGQLARLSGVRQETICRLEKGLHSPTVRTVEKIDRALKRAGTGKRKRRLG